MWSYSTSEEESIYKIVNVGLTEKKRMETRKNGR